MKKLTPMIKQYLSIKESYRDAILLFRLGDFYEMFNEDAEIASRVLNIALTSRNNMPMCGVPYHAAEGYIKRLLDAGYKVAICEQVEDPSTAKGIVKREVVRVITPGTYLETEEGSGEDEFVAALYKGRKSTGLAAASVNTGRILIHQDQCKGVLELIEKLNIKTLIHPPGIKPPLEGIFCEEVDDWLFDPDGCRDTIKEHFKGEPESLGLGHREEALRALGALIHYLKRILMAPTEHLKRVEIYIPEGKAQLDPSTAKHLEVVANLRDGGRENTLLEVLDRTCTPMGYRRLKDALLNPLYDAEAIEERLNAVHYLTDRDLSAYLKGIGDIERMISRIESLMARPKELHAVKNTLWRIPHIRAQIEDSDSKLVSDIAERLHPLDEVAETIEAAVAQEEGRLIRDGYSPELDELRRIVEDSESWIRAYEEKERARTGIPSLKVRYNKVFGYYIEVTKAHLSKVPEDYIRKQTLVGAERFITEELKEVEEKIASASERIDELEKQLYMQVLQKIASHAPELREVAQALGELDFLNSLATVARERDYTKPKITKTGEIIVKDGRHPVVEGALKGDFVPNDTVIRPGEIHIITGPNMSGKSTYIRQVALIVLMAQIGSFVPAKKAIISPVDRIMSRIGSADNLAGGQSTFMVEMTETANILNNATENSLVILDEIGRGTSTYDGLAIAWATVEYIRERIRAKTLFATHYHELTELGHRYPEVKNYRVDVKEWEDRIIFTHRLIPGSADKSYGIYVAQIAGMPLEVIERAKRILSELESKNSTPLPLYEHPALVKLRMLNLKKLSPLEALMVLEELKKLAEEPSQG